MHCVLWQQNTFALDCSSWQSERVYCWAAPEDQPGREGPRQTSVFGALEAKMLCMYLWNPNVGLHGAPPELSRQAPCSASAQPSPLLSILPPPVKTDMILVTRFENC